MKNANGDIAFSLVFAMKSAFSKKIESARLEEMLAPKSIQKGSTLRSQKDPTKRSEILNQKRPLPGPHKSKKNSGGVSDEHPGGEGR